MASVTITVNERGEGPYVAKVTIESGPSRVDLCGVYCGLDADDLLALGAMRHDDFRLEIETPNTDRTPR